jgi:hypothetical protein
MVLKKKIEEENKMIFQIIDYHKGHTNKELKAVSLTKLKKFCEKEGYKAVWIDFENLILWVTTYKTFTQR